jgi:hypothetical protein
MAKRKRKKLSPKQSENIAELIGSWVDKFAKHFDVVLGEEQAEIYIDVLSRYSEYQISTGCTRCLTECMFMPRAAEILQRMPEDRQHQDYKGFLQLLPLVDQPRVPGINSEIAREISPALCGRNFAELKMETDARLVAQMCHCANLVRYFRMGRDPEIWHGKDHQFVGIETSWAQLKALAASKQRTWYELTGLPESAHKPYPLPEWYRKEHGLTEEGKAKPPRWPHLVGKGLAPRT